MANQLLLLFPFLTDGTYGFFELLGIEIIEELSVGSQADMDIF
jgi:hypothetical protein